MSKTKKMTLQEAGRLGGQAGTGKKKRRGNREYYQKLGSSGGQAGTGEAKVRGSSAYYRKIVAMRKDREKSG